MNLAIRTKQNKDKTDKQTNHTEGGYFEKNKTNNNNKKLSKKSVRAPRSPIPQTYRVDLVYFIPLKQQDECTFKAQTQTYRVDLVYFILLKQQADCTFRAQTQTYRVDLVYFIPLKQQAECAFKAQTQRTSGKIRAVMYIRAKVTSDTIDRLERKA